MVTKTVIFENPQSAQSAYESLIPMIDVELDFNAISYSLVDEELVKWLISDRYCRLGDKERVYPYPVSMISKSKDITLYQYQEFVIEQKFFPPADWEFITRDSQSKIINRTWWGYEDGLING